MILAALREARAHARRLGLVAAAIVVAVTFMAGTLALADTVRTTTVAQATTDQPPGLAAVVFGDGSLPDQVVATVAAVPGVTRAEGVVIGYAQLLVGGRLVGSADSVAASVPDTPALQVGRLVAGHNPVTAEQMIVDSDTFASEHLRLGQRLQVVSSQPAQLFTVVGELRGLTVSGSPTASVIGVSSTAAARLAGLQGRVTEVFVSATPGLSDDALAARLQAVLGPADRVLTRSELSEQQAASGTAKELSFATTLNVLVVIALVVGAFIIFNAFALVVAQRRRELALLRCLGASRAQLTLLVTGEAGAVGVVSSLVGLAFGLLAAVGLRKLVEASGTALPAGPLQLHWTSALLCLAAGTGVAIVAAVIPALQAARVPALVALRHDPVTEGSAVHPARRRIAVGLALCGAGLIVGAVIAAVPTGAVAGGILLIGGIVGLGQAPVAASAGVLGWPLARWWGFTGALGRQNAVRHPHRTAASSASVVVGVTLMCALAVIASSARSSANGQLIQTVRADLVLMTAGTGSASDGPSGVTPMAPGVVARLRAQPDLGVVSPMSYLSFYEDGYGPDWGGTIDVSTFSRVVGLGPMQGSLAGLRSGGVAVEQNLATARHWHLGEVLPFTFPAQDGADKPVQQSRRISAIFDSLGYYGGFLFSADSLASVYPDMSPSVVFVNGIPGASASTTRLAVARALTGFPQVAVSDPAQVQGAQDQAINRQIDLVAVLSLLALIIGYLGIVTNLTLSVTERVREIGLLRAVGMSSRQLGAAVRFESAIIAALGAVVGAVLGVFMAWALQRALAGDGLTQLAIPWWTLAAYLLLAVGVGIGAGLLPARQAGRVPVLDALAEE